jgi:hypothetical protein
VARAPGCQCTHSGIWGAADEAVLITFIKREKNHLVTGGKKYAVSAHVWENIHIFMTFLWELVVPLVRFDSYSVDYYEVEDKYFKEYPFRINVSTNYVMKVRCKERFSIFLTGTEGKIANLFYSAQKNIRSMVFTYCRSEGT